MDYRDMDDFWDLRRHMPKSGNVKNTPYSPKDQDLSLPLVRESESSCAEIEHAKKEEKISAEGRFSFAASSSPRSEKVTLTTYTIPHNPLICEVRILPDRSEFRFYANFRRDADAMFFLVGTEVPYVPFFSYVPQYMQLNEKQKAYYLWWRENFRKEICLPCDLSYFWLFVYETVVLFPRIPPAEGLSLLCRAWRSYRDTFPAIDAPMAEWISDYCLVHQLACPVEALKDILAEFIAEAEWKEFYLGAPAQFAEDEVRYLLGASSDYMWQRSKILGHAGARELFAAHMEAAVREPLSLLFSSNDIFSGDNVKQISHHAFKRSICSFFYKQLIEVDYYSVYHTPSVRTAVTAIVKYTENKLRAILGIKSRLSVTGLPLSCKSSIDAYFSKLTDAKKKEEAWAARPLYEAQYDAEESELSFSAAASIENASWNVARRLTEEEMPSLEEVFHLPTQAEAQKQETKEEKTEENQEQKPALPVLETAKKDSWGLSSVHLSYLRAMLLSDRPTMAELLRTERVTEASVAEEINMAFSDHFGDVILEISENGITLIPDYYDEVTKWIQER